MQAKILARTTKLSEEQWRDVRRTGIGGSDIAAIAGVNPYRNAMSVYLDKIGQAPEIEENEAMYLGKELEPWVADQFAKKSGKKIQRVNAILQHPEHPFMLANLDRLVLDPDMGKGVLECKTGGAFTAKKWANSEIPESYMLQTQWYLAVTGLKFAWIAALLGGQRLQFSYQLIERDNEMIGYLTEIGRSFWQMVESRTPPALDGSDQCYDLLQTLYAQSQPTEIILPEAEAMPLILQYEKAKLIEKEAVNVKKDALNKLTGMMAENEYAQCGNWKLTWKPVTTKRLDVDALKTAEPCTYERFLVESTSRRPVIKPTKEVENVRCQD